MFCLKDRCSTPFICAECKSSHDKGHQSSFVSVQNFFSDQFASQYAKNLHSRFSAEHIEEIHGKTLAILDTMETEVVKCIHELKKEAEEYFSSLSENVERLRKVYADYVELSNCSLKSEMEVDKLKQLIESYKILKDDIKIFDLSLETVPANLHREVETALNKFKHDSLSKLGASLDLQPLNFTKLKVKTTYSIPNSEGVLYEACAFIPKWKLLAVGFRKNQQGSLGLYSLENHELVNSVSNIHSRWINHVVWVDKRDYVVTCSNDMKIKVFAVSDQGRNVRLISTFRGHSNLVRCIKYLEPENMLVSAGDDPDIKLWDLAGLKRFATISTNGHTNMDGSIAYIPKDKLVGAGFRSGIIRFYHIYKRNCVFEFKTGYESFYTYGLQYLPKKKLIIGRVKERMIQIWKYDEEKKKAEPYKTIKAKGEYPDCIVPNEDESQLLFTSRDQFLETYDFGADKTCSHNLQPYIKKTNALVFLDSLGKVSVCDYASGKICVLN